MKRLTLEQKALEVIEWLVSDCTSQDCEFNSALSRPFSQEQSKKMADKITDIYTISHSANRNHTCFNVHTDWRERTLIIYKKLHKKGLV